MIIEKTYLCPIIGAGTYEDPRRPSVADAPIKMSWFMQELGDTGYCLVSIVAEEEDHKKILLEKDVTHFATKTKVESSVDHDKLKGKFKDLESKWTAMKSSWVTFQEQTGKEE